MAKCAHELIDWEQQDDEDMHCLGWVCRTCGELQIGEYHHRTWCGQNFCGAVAVFSVAVVPRLEPVPR